MDNKRALALGFFDGVHTAHRLVLEKAYDFAQSHSVLSAAVTFDRQPAAFIRGEAQELICTLERRTELLKDEGKMDDVIVLPFDAQMQNTSPRDFAEKILFDKLGAHFIAVGFDYRFGARGEGDAQMLGAFCRERGIPFAIVPRLDADGEKVSSSAVRACLENGETEKAAALLGRSFDFSGTVRHGKALGRTLGFPTMNIPLPDELVCPRAGVYLCRAFLRGAWYESVCNISPERLCEVFMLSHGEDAYGENVTVELAHFVRPMRSFASFEELKKQVDADKQTARQWFRLQKSGNISE